MSGSTRVPWRQIVLGVVFVGCFAVLFWPTFVWMAERFDRHDSFYSHGWLIPPASLWLIWQRRAFFANHQFHASFQGLIMLVPAVVLHVLANRLQLHVVSGFAMLGVIWGLVWTLWGWPMLWVLRFPMLFLLFMVPLPGVLLIAISFHMKLLAASLATHLLTFGGLHAVQAGSMIQVPGVSVIVDDTCSGLRSLISLIALSILWTSLMPPTAKPWQRLTVVGASIPIALTGNMIRIIILVLIAAVYGAGAAEGFLHYGSGVVVFGVALLVLAWLSQSVQQWSLPSFAHSQWRS